MRIKPWAVLAAIALTLGATMPAQAYTQEVVGQYTEPPQFNYIKNISSPLNSQLVAYVTIGTTEYRIKMRAGSGDGTKNECTNDHGWLPDGVYSNTDSDSNSYFKHWKKSSGNAVVRGWVWELGNKKTRCGNMRTELFIHSQGTSGWSDSNYRSEGCIKINQTDRTFLHNQFAKAYQPTKGYLSVWGSGGT